MKQIQRLFLLIALGLFSQLAQSQNLITNGDFSANATGWTTTGTLSYLTHNVTGNVMVLNNADAAGTYYVYQWVPATPGAVYSFNGVAATHAVSGTASIKLQFFAADQTTLLATSSTNNITVSFNANSWTAFPTITYTAPANTAYIKVLGTSVNRALKWDNLTLTTSCTATITGMVFNDMNGGADVPLVNGNTYYLSSLPASFNLEATYTGTVESMRFTLSGSQSQTVTENADPYNFPGTGTAWTYGAGTYTLLVEAFSADNAGGSLCNSQTYTFTIGACNNVTSSGSIGTNQTLCGSSGDPAPLTSISLPSGGSSAPLEYLWLISTDGGTTNSVIPGATLATYDPGPITQTTWYRRCARRQGCTNYDGESNWVQVTLCPNPTVNAGTNQTITCSTTSASIGSSSVSGLTYAWSPATGLSSTSISNPVATPTTTTTYTLTVTNSCGCSSTASVTVTVNKTPPVAVAGSPATLTCSIPSAPIGASSVSGNVYSWSPSTGLSSTTISNPVASPTTTKTYTVTVTGSNGCTATSSVQVTVNKTPPTADAGPDQSVCTAQSASIGAAAIAGNSYSWSPSAGLSASTISNPIATPSSTTTYTVTVTGSNGCSATDAVLVTVNICVVNISGTVFNDLNALLNGNVDGTGLGNPDGTALYANLIASNGTVVNATLVNTNGSWQITNVPVNQNYTVVLSTTSGTSGSPSPVASLPVGWVNTGEDCCDNTGSDGVVNGITAVSVATSNVTQINFGIQQPPTPGTNIQPSQVNPGGNTSVPVPANAWSGTDPSGGIVTSLQITSFPSNANSITVNGTNYTSAGFPSGGISVPTSTNGQPTQPIQIDPVDGVVNVTIPYRVYDNANTPSPNTGYVQLPFTLLSISGNVYEDKNGSQNVDGTPIGQPSSQTVFAILTNASSTVLASVTVSAGGYFQFNNIPANSSFTVLISTVAGTVGAPAPSASLPIGWTHVAEDCCDQVGNDGNTNGATSVTVGMTAVTHVDFGIHQPLSIGNLVWLDVNRNGLKESSESGLAGTVMKLYADANTDGVPDGAALQTTLSDASGLYLFSGLDEGNYIVGATPPAGNVYTSSVIGQELNPNDNTDHNDNGITLSGSELLSGTLQIAANTEPVGELPNNAPLPDVNANLTLDFGFYVCPPAFTFPNPPVCPGNTVDLHAFEPQYFTGGTWMQGTSVLSNVLVGAGTYTYTFQEGTCSSGGPITVENNIPDYTPTLSIAPSAIQGTSTMRIILTVSEIENRTPCSDVYVFVPRLEPRFTMTYDSLATNVGGVSVQNANWQFFNTNPNFYVWKYIGSVAFPALSSSKIGFLGSYNPNQTDGETTFSVQVFQGSGGETNFTNNTDSEILLYFR